MTLRFEYLVYSIIVYCYIQYFLQRITNLQIVSQLDDILIIVFLIVLIISKLNKGNLTLKTTHFDLFIIFFSILFLISGYVNGVPILNFLLSFKTYYIYVILFYCLVNLKPDVSFLKRVKKLIVYCFVLQLPIILGELLYSLVVYGVFADDTTQGTFMGANSLSYSAFMPLLYVTYKLLVQKDRKYLKYFLILLLVLLIPMGEYAIAMYFIVVLPIFLKDSLKSKKKLFLSISLSFLFVLTFLIFIGIKGGFSQQKNFDTLNPVYQYKNLTKRQSNVYSGAQRNLYYPLTFIHLHKHCSNPLIGFGPGMYASYAAFRLMPRPNDLVYNIFGQIEKGMDPEVDSQFIPIWGEFGYIGIILFVLFLLYSIFFFFKKYLIYKSRGYSELEVLAFISSVGSLYLLFGFYTNHFWEAQTIFMSIILFWALFYQEESIIKRHIASV